MTDERTSLEQRVAWLEGEMVRVLWGLIGLVSMMMGALVYWMTFPYVDDWIAFGCAVIAWAVAALYLRRHHFRGAPGYVKDKDP
jgi:hypothetical protein